jgi:hypothetical protein
MNWTCNQAGQCEGTNELWSALVFRPATQATWSALVWLAGADAAPRASRVCGRRRGAQLVRGRDADPE